MTDDRVHGAATVIRGAMVGDAPALARVYDAAEGAIRASLGAGPVEAEQLDLWFEDQLDAFDSTIDACFVAELDGAIVGFAETVGPDELRALYVDPARWGSGIATALHDRAIAHLARCGVAVARLSVIADNPRARRFYEREGWICAGADEPREIGGLELAFVRYRFDLPR